MAGCICGANPIGTDGFEFVESTRPEQARLRDVFARMGFAQVARHRSKDVSLWRQGQVNFILNADLSSFSQAFAQVHGPSACAMAFRVADAAAPFAQAVNFGARPFHGCIGPMELNIPAIDGIGGRLIYFVDRFGPQGWTYDVDFRFEVDVNPHPKGHGLTVIDHLTHNAHRGRMDAWAGFYERLFNFRQIRHFDIEGRLTGLKSRAMTSPRGQIRIPVNESSDDKSQIEEYLRACNGEGIQHIAVGTEDIYASVGGLPHNPCASSTRPTPTTNSFPRACPTRARTWSEWRATASR